MSGRDAFCRTIVGLVVLVTPTSILGELQTTLPSAGRILGVSPLAGQPSQSGYIEITEKFRQVISDATGLKPSAFEVAYDARTEPTHLAAILTSTALKGMSDEEKAELGNLTRSGKPIFFMSARLADLAEDDAQLRSVVRHEFYHEISSDALADYVKDNDSWKTENKKKAMEELIQRYGSKAFEFYSDIMAQEAGIMAGEDPGAAIKMMRNLQKAYGDYSLQSQIIKYIKSSHPEFGERIDALQHAREELKKDRSKFNFANRENRSGRDEVKGLRSSRETDAYVAQAMQELQEQIDLAKERTRDSLKEQESENGTHLPIHVSFELNPPLGLRLSTKSAELSERENQAFAKELEERTLAKIKQFSSSKSSLRDRIALTHAIQEWLNHANYPNHSKNRKYYASPTALAQVRVEFDQNDAAIRDALNAFSKNAKARPSGAEVAVALEIFQDRKSILLKLPEAAASGVPAGEIFKILEHEWYPYSRSSDPSHLSDAIRGDEFLELVQKISRSRPEVVIQQLSALDRILTRYEKGRNGFVLGRSLQNLWEAAVAKLPQSARLDVPFDELMEISDRRKLSLAGLETQIAREVQERFSIGQLYLPYSQGLDQLSDLRALYERRPDLRATLLPILAEHIRTFHSIKQDPEAFQARAEARKLEQLQSDPRWSSKPHSEIAEMATRAGADWRRQVEIELALNYLALRHKAEFQSQRSARTDADYDAYLEKASQSVMKLSDKRLIEASKNALYNIDRSSSGNGPFLQRIQRQTEMTLLSDSVTHPSQDRSEYSSTTNLEMVFAHPKYREALLARLRPLRNQLLEAIAAVRFGDGAPHPSQGAKRMVRVILGEPAQRKAFFMGKAVKGWSNSREGDELAENYQRYFGKDISLEDVLQWSASPEEKLKALNLFQIPISPLDEERAFKFLLGPSQDALLHHSISQSPGPDIRQHFRLAALYANRLEGDALTMPRLTQEFDKVMQRFLGVVKQAPGVHAFRNLESIIHELGTEEWYQVKDASGRIKSALSRYRQRFAQELERAARFGGAEYLSRLPQLGKGMGIDRFTAPLFVNEVFSKTMESPTSPASKAEQLGRLNRFLTVSQLNAAWALVFKESVQGQKFNPEIIAQRIHTIYGRYSDGKLRAYNQVANHFALDKTQMKSLRKLILTDHEIAKTEKAVEVIRGAVKVALTRSKADPLEFVQWLQGRLEAPPAFANDMLREVNSQIYEAASKTGDEKLKARLSDLKDEINLEVINDIYQNNSPVVKMAVISDIFSTNNEHGLLSTPKGKERFLQFVTNGMEEKNLPLARAIIGAYLKANGEQAHVFATQMIAGMGTEKSGSSTDAEKLKALMELKGSLWIKLGQQLYMDPYLIPDDAAREVFKSLLDRAAEPFRETLLQMFEKALRDEYGKVREIRILKSGSINVTALVTLADGSKKVARLVKDNPENYTKFEVETLKKMAAHLREEAASSAELAPTLIKIGDSLEEYVDAMAQKIEVEVDLRRERPMAELVRNSYRRVFPGLGVSMNLVEPAETQITFSNDDNEKSAASAERIIFYDFIDDISGELTQEESLRARRAIVRAEWEALFHLGKYDPDGHRGNWLITRDPNNPKKLLLHRIDYSQAEAMADSVREAFRDTLGRMAGMPYSGTGWESFSKLIRSSLSGPELEEAYLKAKAHRKPNANPVHSMTALMADLKSLTGGKVGFLPEVRMGIKSLAITYGTLDPRKAAERGILVEEFTRIALGKSPTQSYLAGQAATWKERFTKWFKPKEKKGLTTGDTHNDFLKRLADPESNISEVFLREHYERDPSLRKAILDYASQKFLKEHDSELYDFLNRSFGPDPVKAWSKLFSQSGRYDRAERVAKDILRDEHRQGYDLAYQYFLQNPSLLSENEFYSRSFADYLTERAKHDPHFGPTQLLYLKEPLFPELMRHSKQIALRVTNLSDLYSLSGGAWLAGTPEEEAIFRKEILAFEAWMEAASDEEIKKEINDWGDQRSRLNILTSYFRDVSNGTHAQNIDLWNRLRGQISARFTKLSLPFDGGKQPSLNERLHARKLRLSEGLYLSSVGEEFYLAREHSPQNFEVVEPLGKHAVYNQFINREHLLNRFSPEERAHVMSQLKSLDFRLGLLKIDPATGSFPLDNLIDSGEPFTDSQLKAVIAQQTKLGDGSLIQVLERAKLSPAQWRLVLPYLREKFTYQFSKRIGDIPSDLLSPAERLWQLLATRADRETLRRELPKVVLDLRESSRLAKILSETDRQYGNTLKYIHQPAFFDSLHFDDVRAFRHFRDAMEDLGVSIEVAAIFARQTADWKKTRSSEGSIDWRDCDQAFRKISKTR
jgi:hypothetical protein